MTMRPALLHAALAALVTVALGSAPAFAAKKPDRDGDGIADSEDKCPDDPEDKDGFEDADGCSEADNDGDGFDDYEDACPMKPETINGVEDGDGCPDEEKARLLYKKGRILIREPVHFATGKHTILKKSYPLLLDMASFMKGYPRFKKIRVEGHTDNVGNAAKNLSLSELRAKAVMEFLIRHGVPEPRLSSEGFGDTKPVADNKTKAGRAKNRRVDFIVTEEM